MTWLDFFNWFSPRGCSGPFLIQETGKEKSNCGQSATVKYAHALESVCREIVQFFFFLKAAMSAICTPPQPGDESYETFIKVRSQGVSNSLPRINFIKIANIRVSAFFSDYAFI